MRKCTSKTLYASRRQQTGCRFWRRRKSSVTLHQKQRIALCFALPCGEPRQSRGQAAIKKKGAPTLWSESITTERLKTVPRFGCSIPQSDSIFKRTFFKKSLILKILWKKSQIGYNTRLKNKRRSCPRRLMAPLAWLEQATPWLTVRCSNRLS